MFQGKRFVTKGVADNVPLEVQMFLWSLLDNLIAKRLVEVDYLQVFELSSKNGNQKIIHRQEAPDYQAVYWFNTIASPLKNTLYIIDNSSYVTMLLCDEY